MFSAPQIDLGSLAEICRRVGMSLQAGIDARRVWASEAERHSGELKERLLRIRAGIDGGQSLADAMAGRAVTQLALSDASLEERAAQAFRPADAPFDGDGYFPPLVIEMVEVGEASGHVDAAFLELAGHYENLAAMRGMFLSGLIWPALQLVIALAIVGLLIYIAGPLSQMIGQPLDFLGIGLTGASGLAIYVVFLVLLGGAGLYAWTAVERGWSGSGWLINLAMKTPAIGACLRSMALARFCWSLALAHEAGMDARRTAAAALRATENGWYLRHASLIDEMLRAGRPFHESFRSAGVFPDELLHTLEAAEESGQITESLLRLAGKYQEEGKQSLTNLTILAGWICWGIVALILIALILRLGIWYVGQIQNALHGLK